MKGTFSNIKYMTTGAPGPESNNVGCIVGIPMVVGNAQRIDTASLPMNEMISHRITGTILKIVTDPETLAYVIAAESADDIAGILEGDIVNAVIEWRDGDEAKTYVPASFIVSLVEKDELYLVMLGESDPPITGPTPMNVILTFTALNPASSVNTERYTVRLMGNLENQEDYIIIKCADYPQILDMVSKGDIILIRGDDYEHGCLSYAMKVIGVNGDGDDAVIILDHAWHDAPDVGGKDYQLIVQTTDTCQTTLKIRGTDLPDDYVAGDVLHSASFKIKRAGADDYITISLNSEIVKANYGTGDVVAELELFSEVVSDEAGVYEYDPLAMTLTINDKDYTSNVSVGDTIVLMPQSGKTYEKKCILTVTEAPYFEMGKSIIGARPVNFTGAVEGALYKVSTYSIYTDYAGATLGTPGNPGKRGYALYCDYVVYRTSEKGVRTISSVADLVNVYGSISIANPLSNLPFGAYMYALASGMANKFKVCALDLSGVLPATLMEITPETIMGTSSYWLAATTEIDKHKDIYYLATLTGDATIQDTYISYVNTASGMQRGREKMYYMPKSIINGGDLSESGIPASFGNYYYGDQDNYEVARKYSDGYIGEGGAAVPFNKDADVELAASVPMPYNNERVVFIGAEYASIGDINIEGYYLSAIIAGWRSAMPVAYVADDMKVPLITDLPSRDGYYSGDDLDALASSGWYMLQQTGNGPITCYMQKTTAYDSEEKGEESLVIALDMAMRDIRAALKQYIKGGLNNRKSPNGIGPLSERYLASLNAAIAFVRDKYMKAEVFSALDIISVLPSETSRTATNVVVRFMHYYPAREIYVTGYVE